MLRARTKDHHESDPVGPRGGARRLSSAHDLGLKSMQPARLRHPWGPAGLRVARCKSAAGGWAHRHKDPLPRRALSTSVSWSLPQTASASESLRNILSAMTSTPRRSTNGDVGRLFAAVTSSVIPPAK